MTRTHAAMCEAEADHPHDCSLATELARLRAFAEAVRDEVQCVGMEGHLDDGQHLTDCLHCAAAKALERAR